MEVPADSRKRKHEDVNDEQRHLSVLQERLPEFKLKTRVEEEEEEAKLRTRVEEEEEQRKEELIREMKRMEGEKMAREEDERVKAEARRKEIEALELQEVEAKRKRKLREMEEQKKVRERELKYKFVANRKVEKEKRSERMRLALMRRKGTHLVSRSQRPKARPATWSEIVGRQVKGRTPKPVAVSVAAVVVEIQDAKVGLETEEEEEEEEEEKQMLLDKVLQDLKANKEKVKKEEKKQMEKESSASVDPVKSIMAPGSSSKDGNGAQSKMLPGVPGPSSRDAQSRIFPPGQPTTARAPPPGPAELAIIRCNLCEFTAKSRKRLKKHMESHIIVPEAKAKEVEEELGNLSIDGVFESFSGDEMNDELNTARVVDVEDEFDDVEEVGMLFSRRRSSNASEQRNSYNGSDEDEGDEEIQVDRRSPEEITLASEPEEEPEEITLDEGDEGELAEKPKKVVKDKAKEEKEELAKLEEMDDLLGKPEFVEQMIESGNMLARFNSN